MDLHLTVDLVLITRCLVAVFWGVGLAAWLQFTRLGAFLAQERTWVTVVMGVGVDLIITVGGDWWTFVAVVGCSSLGVIARSLVNEARFEPDLNAYRTKWGMEDTIDGCGDVIGLLERALRDETHAGYVARVSEALAIVHRVQRTMQVARYGEPGARRR